MFRIRGDGRAPRCCCRACWRTPDYRVGPAKHLLALNAGHRFHHLKWAGAGDVNFGLFTLIWDHLYRTYSYDPARRFTSAELGMTANPHYPTAYPAQLRHPFTADGGC